MAAEAVVAGGRRRSENMKETAMKHLESNIEQASVYIQSGDIDKPRVYGNTCMKLGSAIDSVIAANAFPSSSHLPKLLLIVREVYRRKTDMMQPSLMLLMLPIKAACQIGWFPDGDKNGLLMIAKEVSHGFSDTDKMNIEPSNAHSTVSDIVSRFYPTMKVERILTSLDVKPGYGTFVADFHISLGATPRLFRDLRLLVAQVDNMDTAACITSPWNADFLINGCRVPNRTKYDMGNGPQLPSNITNMIKYGLNLLQVIGDFDGQYIIALAFMSSISSPDPSELQDYIHPVSGGVNTDCDASETSSWISLCCPISQHRIKTPVKGHLCKHSQCFDYHNFIEMNSTKPTWKCPLCDNPVSNQDIRIDRNFLKILNEAAKDVDGVIISKDGSWMVAESNRNLMRHATVTTHAVPLGQSPLKPCATKQAQITTVFTSTAGSPGQTRVNVSTTNQAQSTTAFTATAGSRGETQVNVSTKNKAQSTNMFTPPAVSPGQTQGNAYTITQAKSSMMFRPPAGSPSQIRTINCKTNQAQSTIMFTPPAAAKKPAVSRGQTQARVWTPTQAKSTTMFTPPASQRARNTSRVLPFQLLEASGDAMPSGRMRGSLGGDELEAARLKYLAPPQQPARAKEPWPRPPIPSPSSPFLKPQNPANSGNV